MGVNSRIELGQALHDPGSIQPRAEALVNELQTLAPNDLLGHTQRLLQDRRPKAKRRKTSSIPGYSCFSIIPEGTKARRRTPRAAQETINKLRKRGACMLCRIRNVKCSLEDPCTECQQLLAGKRRGPSSIVFLSPCLRSFTEADPFQYLRNTEFCFVTKTKPQWSHWATGRLVGYDSLEGIKLLAIVHSVKHKTTPGASQIPPEVHPGSWSCFASDVLSLVDAFVKRKKFWEDRNSALILTATMDLLMGVCLDIALHFQELSERRIVSEDARIYSNLIERCKFCVRKVLTFRKIMLHRLDTTESSYLEEAAFSHLSKVTPRSAAVENVLEVLRDVRTHSYRIERCLSSKELLALQSLRLNDTELLRESLSHGADSPYAHEAQHYRLGVMKFPYECYAGNILSQILAAAREIERRHEFSL
ncbi:hypothetical protein LTR42_009585 [Elasticomyces elasticus]|nr:hypothetical protein LTR42_009585 [Elasticomyces elasticus]